MEHETIDAVRCAIARQAVIEGMTEPAYLEFVEKQRLSLKPPFFGGATSVSGQSSRPPTETDEVEERNISDYSQGRSAKASRHDQYIHHPTYVPKGFNEYNEYYEWITSPEHTDARKMIAHHLSSDVTFKIKMEKVEEVLSILRPV